MTDLHYLTIADAGDRIRAGDLKSRDLVEASLARIDTTDEALKSFITVLNDDALAAADDADREIAAGGWKGPLHGVPLALKDIYGGRSDDLSFAAAGEQRAGRRRGLGGKTQGGGRRYRGEAGDA